MSVSFNIRPHIEPCNFTAQSKNPQNASNFHRSMLRNSVCSSHHTINVLYSSTTTDIVNWISDGSLLKRAYRGGLEILRGWVAESSNRSTLYWVMTNESLLSFDSLNLRWEEGLGHDHYEPLDFLLGLQTYCQQEVTIIAVWAAVNDTSILHLACFVTENLSCP